MPSVMKPIEAIPDEESELSMQNKDAVVLALFRAVEERDREALLALYHDDLVARRPLASLRRHRSRQGRDAGAIGCALRDDVAWDLGSVAAD
jgi:ketosteroid isomerase-like protein